MCRMKETRKELEPHLIKFGKNLKKVRAEKQMTQENLADKAQLAPRVLQKIEAGQTNILITTALRLKTALNCEWEELMKF